MTRIPLTHGSRWFNLDTATRIDEGCVYDGSNYISMATGTQWEHEELYRTASGRWILRTWSQRAGIRGTYEEISDAAAARWLVRNDRNAEHPAIVQAIAQLEIP